MSAIQVLAVILILLFAAVFGVGLSRLVRAIRIRGINRWFPYYLAQRLRRREGRTHRQTHLILCIADHYEPDHAAKSPEEAMSRVTRWITEYPRQFSQFRDRDGFPPRHTFFYPMEQYDEAHLNALTDLCRRGFGEVEIHLHHDKDTSEGVRRFLANSRDLLAERHGLLATRKSDGARMYAFIHGSWALDNSHPEGLYCGVNDEIDALVETGCYVDMTMPSTDRCQTQTINSIYYATDDPARPCSHNRGTPVEVGRCQPSGALMLIQGPLVLDWGRRIFGLIPRVENACIQAGQAATLRRVTNWIRAGVGIPQRPDWVFVKLHAHGGDAKNLDVMIGSPMAMFHQSLADQMAAAPNFHVHYVTAREMYNLAKAAEAGWKGSVAEARDYELVWNGATSPARTSLTAVGGSS